MRRRLGLGLSVVFGVLAVGLLGRCFSPDLPACSFRCGPADPMCPDEYECRADGYCHLLGSTAACPFSMDLAPAPDLSSADGGTSDGSPDGGG